MQTEQIKQACAVIQALANDWALVEDVKDDEHLILIDESRDIMEGLKPKRAFIASLEEKGYMRNFGVSLNAEPQYGEYTTETNGHSEVHRIRNPHVFDFRPTPKGLALLSAEDSHI
jgi:hypothetical protein